MTTPAHAPDRSFLDVAEAETTTDASALKHSLLKAAHEAELLGLPNVKEHIEAALAHFAERAEDEA